METCIIPCEILVHMCTCLEGEWRVWSSFVVACKMLNAKLRGLGGVMRRCATRIKPPDSDWGRLCIYFELPNGDFAKEVTAQTMVYAGGGILCDFTNLLKQTYYGHDYLGRRYQEFVNYGTSGVSGISIVSTCGIIFAYSRLVENYPQYQVDWCYYDYSAKRMPRRIKTTKAAVLSRMRALGIPLTRMLYLQSK